VTRVGDWWRDWWERRIPLMEPELSRLDVLDGVGSAARAGEAEPADGERGGHEVVA
jgi:hypothetical protein